MVLVDSSVIIDFLNSKRYEVELTKLIIDRQIVVTEIIIMEVLQGAKDEKVYQKIKNFMDLLKIVSPTYEDYIFSANIYRSCRKKGKTIRKSIDCLIASIAINNNLTLFANDKDFKHIKECFDLKLF